MKKLKGKRDEKERKCGKERGYIKLKKFRGIGWNKVKVKDKGEGR